MRKYTKPDSDPNGAGRYATPTESTPISAISSSDSASVRVCARSGAVSPSASARRSAWAYISAKTRKTATKPPP